MEAEYLFYFFRKCCKYPQEHMPAKQFRVFFPKEMVKNEDIKFLFHLFKDMNLYEMGLPTISYKSFLQTLSIINRGSSEELAQLITNTLFHLQEIKIPKKSTQNKDEIQVRISKKDILRIYYYLSKMDVPTISPLPTLWKKNKKGEILFCKISKKEEEERNRFSEDEENDYFEDIDNDSYDASSLFMLNKRVIVNLNKNMEKIKLEDHENLKKWLHEFLQDILLEDETVEYSKVSHFFI